MQAQIIPIGNSLGVRLPKSVLASLQLERASQVDIRTRGGSIVLSPVKKARAGWAEAFAAHADAAGENLWGDVPLAEVWGDESEEVARGSSGAAR